MNACRQTKIVATLGPQSSSEAVIGRLLQAGANVFRLNFSHGTWEEHAARLQLIRALGARLGRPIGVFADLQGPKLRLGTFAHGPVALAAGAPFRLDLGDAPGDTRRAPLPHAEVFAAIEPGAALLLDDGRVRLEVTACGSDFAETRVIVGGVLSDRKGINLPGVLLPISTLTAKDRRDLQWALDAGIDQIALSFVQRPEDVAEARALIGGRAQLIVKLEKPSAIDHLLSIVALADAVMVARGDLGVEVPAEEVPVLQKRIVRACRSAGKPVIIATQMLESMLNAPAPTRAEASDVANAVYEGVDAVMLSGETAAGRYPVEAVTIMDKIIRKAEHDHINRNRGNGHEVVPETTESDAVSAAARDVAATIGAAAIVALTTGGTTALRAARERPAVPILALTPSAAVARNLALVWGVQPRELPIFGDYEPALAEAIVCACALGLAHPGARLVVMAGLPLPMPGHTNLLHIVEIPEETG